MAFPGDWGRRCKLTVQSSQVPAALTDFPVALTLATLPSEMFDADGTYPALNGGGDLRFTSDAAGTVLLSCEVVTFVTDNDPANGSAEIHVKLPSISAVSDTDFYVWYNAAGKSQPARDSAGDTDGFKGSEDVWSDTFQLVTHLESPSGDQTDSSANQIALSAQGGPGISTGILGESPDYNGSNEYHATAADQPSLSFGNGTTNYPGTVSMFANMDDATNFRALVKRRTGLPGDGNNEWGFLTAGDDKLYLTFWDVQSPEVQFYVVTDAAITADENAWVHYAGTVDDAASSWDAKLYRNGSAIASTITDNGVATRNNKAVASFNIGRDNALGLFANGQIDEVRIALSERSGDYLTAEYNAISSPAMFVVEGTPEIPTFPVISNPFTDVFHSRPFHGGVLQ